MITGNELVTPAVKPGHTYKDGSYEQPYIVGGLTIRQHFAAMALQGLVTQQAPVDRIISESNNHLLHQLSKASVIIADALIAELNKTEKA